VKLGCHHYKEGRHNLERTQTQLSSKSGLRTTAGNAEREFLESSTGNTVTKSETVFFAHSTARAWSAPNVTGSQSRLARRLPLGHAYEFATFAKEAVLVDLRTYHARRTREMPCRGNENCNWTVPCGIAIHAGESSSCSWPASCRRAYSLAEGDSGEPMSFQVVNALL
jgi:hypothetical protein